MGNTVLGVVAPLPQGAWNSTTTYQKLSVVREGNSSYIAKSANVNIQPGVTDSWETYWMLLNEDGDTGQQGPQGETGVGVPDGGLKGDILVKRSQDNYDDEWVDPDNITVGNATKALQDENGNNIADTYQTKQDSTTQNTALQTQITSNTQGITQNSQLISRNSARLTNVEQRISPSPFVTDSTVAYVKDVPANALPYAELQRLGGMTYRVNLGTEEAPNYVLRSAPATSAESVGANLLPFPYAQSTKTVAGVTWTVHDDGRISVSGTATGYSAITLLSGMNIKGFDDVYFYLGGSHSNLVAVVTLYDSAGNILKQREDDVGIRMDISSYPTADSLNIYLKRSDNVEITGNFYPMLNKGSTALPYAPYTKSPLPIPEAVQALDGYGDGINESVYNYITWNPEGNVKTYTKAVEKGVFDGTENITLRGQNAAGLNAFLCSINPFAKIAPLSTDFDFVEFVTGASTVLNGSATDGAFYMLYNSSTSTFNSVYFISAQATVEDFKQSIIGKSITYALATPEVTDISALITADNLLPVQGNGTITFVNEYGYAVPSTVEYMT